MVLYHCWMIRWTWRWPLQCHNLFFMEASHCSRPLNSQQLAICFLCHFCVNNIVVIPVINRLTGKMHRYIILITIGMKNNNWKVNLFTGLIFELLTRGVHRHCDPQDPMKSSQDKKRQTIFSRRFSKTTLNVFQQTKNLKLQCVMFCSKWKKNPL